VNQSSSSCFWSTSPGLRLDFAYPAHEQRAAGICRAGSFHVSSEGPCTTSPIVSLIGPSLLLFELRIYLQRGQRDASDDRCPVPRLRHTQAIWGHWPSPLSPDLDHLAPRGPQPGTRSGRVRTVEADTQCENDPIALEHRLPRRTANWSSQPNLRP